MWHPGGRGAGGAGLLRHVTPSMSVCNAAGRLNWFLISHTAYLYRANASNSAKYISEARLQRPGASSSVMAPPSASTPRIHHLGMSNHAQWMIWPEMAITGVLLVHVPSVQHWRHGTPPPKMMINAVFRFITDCPAR